MARVSLFHFYFPFFFLPFFFSFGCYFSSIYYFCLYLFSFVSNSLRSEPAKFRLHLPSFLLFFFPFISNFDRLAMTDGHSAPPSDAPAPAAAADCTAAPVPADVRSHAHHHQAAPTHDKEQASSMGRITPRPTFLEHLATSRDSQFQLDRRDSSELDRYFVSQCYCELI